MHVETGFLRVPSPAAVEFLVSDPTGVAQVYTGVVVAEDDAHTLTLTSTSVTLVRYYGGAGCTCLLRNPRPLTPRRRMRAHADPDGQGAVSSLRANSIGRAK